MLTSFLHLSLVYVQVLMLLMCYVCAASCICTVSCRFLTVNVCMSHSRLSLNSDFDAILYHVSTRVPIICLIVFYHPLIVVNFRELVTRL